MPSECSTEGSCAFRENHAYRHLRSRRDGGQHAPVKQTVAWVVSRFRENTPAAATRTVTAEPNRPSVPAGATMTHPDRGWWPQGGIPAAGCCTMHTLGHSTEGRCAIRENPSPATSA